MYKKKYEVIQSKLFNATSSIFANDSELNMNDGKYLMLDSHAQI